MVHALLNGTKTQTRRAMKPQPSPNFKWCRVKCVGPWFHIEADEPQTVMHTVTAKLGMPGERLWVKETFKHVDNFHGQDCTWYRADNDTFPGSWKPSIFMRRAYSRITLEITEVRVERLNDISEEDAKAEGCSRKVWITSPFSAGALNARGKYGTCRDSYRDLWESINGADSWAVNPWVWAITFKRLTP